MASLPFSVTLLALITILIFLGLGQRVLDHMRLTDSAAIIILLLMVAGHFLPTISLSPHLAVNLGGFIPIGVVIYLLVTTSRVEQRRASAVSLLTALLILLSDKLLPLLPGLLDPVLSGGIFAGLLATFFGRSRRSAFIAGLLGVFLVDVANVVQLRVEAIEQQITVGGGGLFSSMVVSCFLAVIIAEVIGEIREKIQLGGDHDE
ncbi:MAG TPA: hypothetical protein DDZ66_01960 [Firmicutes bacterium]|mgnify:CR=1 FL=1|jgi:uncharacterized membrane protein|nr:hypothetical protein [Bacillota bacterium]